MTMVDPMTGWFEQSQLYGLPTAYRCQEMLDNIWLLCLPKPKEFGFDYGSELKVEFNELCDNMGIQRRPNNAWNQENSLGSSRWIIGIQC